MSQNPTSGILTAEDIRLIFDKIGRKVVVPATNEFPYEVVSRGSQGYHDDPAISNLQAKLSIMLQVAAEVPWGTDSVEDLVTGNLGQNENPVG